MKSGCTADLKSLFNSTVDAVESLRSLNAPVDHWDNFLVPLIVKRLDQRSLMAWEESVDKLMEPSKYSDLVEFLTTRLLQFPIVE